MKTKEEIINSYQATFALSKTSKAQIYMAMEEYHQQFASQSSDKEERDLHLEIAVLQQTCTDLYKAGRDSVTKEDFFDKATEALDKAKLSLSNTDFSPPKESEGKELSEIKYLIKCIANSK